MNPGILYVEFLVLAHRIHRLSTACGQSCHGFLGIIHEPWNKGWTKVNEHQSVNLLIRKSITWVSAWIISWHSSYSSTDFVSNPCGCEVYTWHWSIASLSKGLNSRRCGVARGRGPTVAVRRNEEVLVQGETGEDRWRFQIKDWSKNFSRQYDRRSMKKPSTLPPFFPCHLLYAFESRAPVSFIFSSWKLHLWSCQVAHHDLSGERVGIPAA